MSDHNNSIHPLLHLWQLRQPLASFERHKLLVKGFLRSSICALFPLAWSRRGWETEEDKAGSYTLKREWNHPKVGHEEMVKWRYLGVCEWVHPMVRGLDRVGMLWLNGGLEYGHWLLASYLIEILGKEGVQVQVLWFYSRISPLLC